MLKNKKTRKPKTHSKDRTFVAFLLDRTGSMAEVLEETIRGFNSYLDTLLANPESKEITFDLTQFDSEGIDVVHDSVALKNVAKLTHETYKPRSWTPLYDAIGRTVRRVEEKTKHCKVLFVTLTDGKENCSREFNLKTVRELIKSKENQDKWTFTYIGIGPEAWEANAVLSKGTQGWSNNLRATRGRNTEKAYQFMAQGTMLRVNSAGGQCVNSLYAGKQLDTEEEQT